MTKRLLKKIYKSHNIIHKQENYYARKTMRFFKKITSENKIFIVYLDKLTPRNFFELYNHFYYSLIVITDDKTFYFAIPFNIFIDIVYNYKLQEFTCEFNISENNYKRLAKIYFKILEKFEFDIMEQRDFFNYYKYNKKYRKD